MGFLSKLFGRSPKPGKPRHTSPATFAEDVLDAELPVVVDFWATWCQPCQVMSGLLEELAPQYAGRVDFFKLNLDHSAGIAGEYGVRSIPTLAFFHQGALVGRVVGVTPLNDLRAQFDRLAALAAGQTGRHSSDKE
ncbi:MAG TPA: thioredoxin [Acidobacteriota bacterium]|nr:thioredoxin [Acidobacteriota bacterium]